MNATTTIEASRDTGVWAHGIKSVIHHAETYGLPHAETIDTGRHPSGQMMLTVRLARTALAAWLGTVQVLTETVEYRHPHPGDPWLQVYAQVRLPDTGVLVVLAGTRPYTAALSLVEDTGVSA